MMKIMLEVFLTDVQNTVQFKDYPGDHPVKFILNFKKIFPSVMELLLPVLPESEDLEQMTWESTTQDFETFKKLLSGWGVIELRLQALSQYKNKKQSSSPEYQCIWRIFLVQKHLQIKQLLR